MTRAARFQSSGIGQPLDQAEVWSIQVEMNCALGHLTYADFPRRAGFHIARKRYGLF